MVNMFSSKKCTVARLVLVMPATNATSQRAFFTMRRLKGYLQNRSGQARLNHLMVLNVYRGILHDLDFNIIARVCKGY